MSENKFTSVALSLAYAMAVPALALADAGQRNDPGNTQAGIIRQAAGRVGEGDLSPEPSLRLVQFSGTSKTRGENGVTMEHPLPEFDDDAGRFLSQVEQRRRAQEGALKAEVREGLVRARKRMRTEPRGVGQDLKLLLEDVERASDIDDDVRGQLRALIVTTLREAQQQEIEEDVRQKMALENLAVSRDQQRIVDALARDDRRIQQILDQFNALMQDGRYDIAEAAAEEAERLDPQLPAAAVARVGGRLASNYQRNLELRHQRERAVLDTLHSVERSHEPFDDSVPLVYPDADVWQELSARRIEKYGQFELFERGSAEARIAKELGETAKGFDFVDTPLQDVATTIEDYHGIEVVIDGAALKADGLDATIPVSQQLSGITLRSALRLTLEPLQLTYVVEDEVLKFTTLIEAETNLITNVYPVADLVIPVESRGGLGGFGGGFGGGLGGLGGGSGGGLGGGGGGLGGVGGGGFGGGGFFNVGAKPLNAVK